MLQATAVAPVPGGNVYLYNGNTPGVSGAQRLILALPATLRTMLSAEATFEPPGALTVTKVISGPAAGRRQAITIAVTCNDVVVLRPLFAVLAGNPAGSVSQTYAGVAAGSVCSVVETADGHTAGVTVTKPRSGQQIVLPPGGTATAELVDVCDTGQLVVRTTIPGDAAGRHSAETITVGCDGDQLADFVVPAGTANGSGTGGLTDSYELIDGSFVVTRKIAGSAAGRPARSDHAPDAYQRFISEGGTWGGRFLYSRQCSPCVVSPETQFNPVIDVTLAPELDVPLLDIGTVHDPVDSHRSAGSVAGVRTAYLVDLVVPPPLPNTQTCPSDVKPFT